MKMQYLTISEFCNNHKDEKFRFIYTGVTDPLHGEILLSIEGQLSDGYWENSIAMEKYWKNENVIFDDEKNEFVIAVPEKSGEWKMEPYRYSYREQRMLKRNKWYDNPFHKMSDEKILNWFATKIKQLVKAEEKSNYGTNWENSNYGTNWWNENPERELGYLGYDSVVKVQDCKNLYKILKGGY